MASIPKKATVLELATQVNEGLQAELKRCRAFRQEQSERQRQTTLLLKSAEANLCRSKLAGTEERPASEAEQKHQEIDDLQRRLARAMSDLSEERQRRECEVGALEHKLAEMDTLKKRLSQEIRDIEIKQERLIWFVDQRQKALEEVQTAAEMELRQVQKEKTKAKRMLNCAVARDAKRRCQIR
eukprot:s3250_g12.t1